MKYWPLLILILVLGRVQAEGDISTLKDSLNVQNHKLRNLKGEILEIDKRIGQENNKYIQKIERINSLILVAQEMEVVQKSNKEKILESYGKVQKVFNYLVLSKLEKDDFSERKKAEILKQALELQIQELNLLLRDNQTLEDTLLTLKMKMNQIKTDETSLYSLLQELKKDKEYLNNTYWVQSTELVGIRKKIEEIELQKMAQKLDQHEGHFSLPVNGKTKIQATKKGVNFVAMQDSTLIAPKEGRVVYVGELSTFGRVLMIDHGMDRKTVLLGDFEPHARKGDRVERESKIGSIQSGKEVYFEVRNKSRIENALALLDLKEAPVSESVVR